MITCEEIIKQASFIKPTEIHAAFCHAILNDKAHTARLITEQLRERHPKSRKALDLDTLVMLKYFE